jgi:hypothetical protein
VTLRGVAGENQNRFIGACISHRILSDADSDHALIRIDPPKASYSRIETHLTTGFQLSPDVKQPPSKCWIRSGPAVRVMWNCNDGKSALDRQPRYRVVVAEEEDAVHRISDDAAREHLSESPHELVLRSGAILVLVNSDAFVGGTEDARTERAGHDPCCCPINGVEVREPVSGSRVVLRYARVSARVFKSPRSDGIDPRLPCWDPVARETLADGASTRVGVRQHELATDRAFHQARESFGLPAARWQNNCAGAKQLRT